MIQANQLAKIVQKVGAMHLNDKEIVMDEIYQTQPNLLGSVLVLPRFGVSMEDMDVLLNILLTLYLATKFSGLQLPMISEALQEHELEKLKQSILFGEGMTQQLQKDSIAQYFETHGEKVLLAYVMETLKKAGLMQNKASTHFYIQLSAFNLVNCIDAAQKSL